jgi:hypothetical protein
LYRLIDRARRQPGETLLVQAGAAAGVTAILVVASRGVPIGLVLVGTLAGSVADSPRHHDMRLDAVAARLRRLTATAEFVKQSGLSALGVLRMPLPDVPVAADLVRK